MKQFVCGILLVVFGGCSFASSEIIPPNAQVREIITHKGEQKVCIVFETGQSVCELAFFGAPNTPTPEGTFYARFLDPTWIDVDGIYYNIPILNIGGLYAIHGYYATQVSEIISTDQ
jgi:hypothetical protein